ncbi:MAG: hypothetical protein K2X87_09615, partial [Gemmataceae bacterium]|nr:hypothetical protein [Gemmataceae bacterium]
TEYEAIDSPPLVFPGGWHLPRYPTDSADRPEWDTGPVGRLVTLLLSEAVTSGVQQVRIVPFSLRGEVVYRVGGEFQFDYHGMIYTVGVAVADTADGPRIDFDISDRFELA